MTEPGAKAVKKVGRPRSFDRDRALDCAMHLFWEKGFKDASLRDLTEAMEIRPASLYAAFGDKQTLFDEALERYLAGPADFVQKALEEPTALQAAEKILRGTAEFLTGQRTRSGCLTIQAALVGGQESEPIRSKLCDLRARGQRALRLRLERAQREGDLSKEIRAADLARFVTTVFQGMTVQALDGASRKQLLRVADMALRAWPK